MHNNQGSRVLQVFRNAASLLAMSVLLQVGQAWAIGNPPIIDSISPSGRVYGPVDVVVSAHDRDGGTLQFEVEVDCPSGRRKHSGSASSSYQVQTFPFAGETCAVYVDVTDPQANRASAATSVEVDYYRVHSGPPIAGFVWPRNGDPVNRTVRSGAIELDVRLLGPSPISWVGLYVDGDLLDRFSGEPPYVVGLGALPTGVHRLSVIAFDHASQQSEEAFVEVGITDGDNSRPTAQITSPAPGESIVLPGPIPLAVAASDTDGVVDRVEYFANGLRIGVAHEPPFTLAWTPPTVGTYKFSTRAYDADGAASAMSGVVSVAVTPNLQPGTPTITSPTTGTVGVPVPLTATASDPDGTPLSGVRFIVRSSPGNAIVFDQTDSATPYAVNWTPSVVGNYEVTGIALDDGPSSLESTPVAISISAGASAQILQLTPDGSPPGSGIEGDLSAPTCLRTIYGNVFVPGYNRHVFIANQQLALKARVNDADNNVSAVKFERLSSFNGSTKLLGTVGAAAGDANLYTGTYLVTPSDVASSDLPSNYPRVQWLRATAVEPGTAGVSALAPIAWVPTNATITTCNAPPGQTFCLPDPRVITLTSDGQSVRIEAEHFDQGGHGVSFFDTDVANAAGALVRDYDGVDLAEQVCWFNGTSIQCRGAATCDSLDDAACLVEPSPGEWMTYSFHITDGGPYTISGHYYPSPVGNPCSGIAEPPGSPETAQPIGSITIAGTEGSIALAPEGDACSGHPQYIDPDVGVTCPIRFVGNLPAGDYVMKYTATNGALLDYLVVTRGQFVSGTPEVTMLLPQNNATFAPGSSILLSADVGGGDNPLVSFEFRPVSGGSFVQACSDPNPGRPYSCTWATPTQSQSYDVRAKAIVSGSTYYSPYTRITLTPSANQPPVVSMTQPAAGQTFGIGETVALAADASDPDAGQSVSVQFYALRQATGAAPIAIGLPDASAPYGATWTPPLEGGWELYAIAMDSAAAPNQGIRESAHRVVQVVNGSGGLATPRAPVLATPPASDSSSEVVGSTAGEFRVDEAGNATYSIPIQVLPGTAGVAPSLALTYNSSAGDGYLGVGWNISGMQAISRCRRSVEAGDALQPLGPAATGLLGHDALRFTEGGTERDVYCLNDQRLLQINAGTVAHGSPSAEYRTEIDAFAKITVVDDASLPNVSGAEQFVVEGKDGTRTTFGGSTGLKTSGGSAPTRSRLFANKASGGANGTITTTQYTDSAGRRAVMRWSQSRTEDSVGNTIDYFYDYGGPGAEGDELSGEQFIKEIHYSGHTSGAAPLARVVFVYSDSNPTVQPEYALTSGMLLKRSRRLDRIDIHGTAAEAVRSYRLEYADSPATGQRRLISVQECANSAGTICFPKTRFEWLSPPLGVSSSSSTTVPGEVFNDPSNLKAAKAVKFGDVNGDGLTDLVWARNLTDFGRDICWSLARPGDQPGEAFTYQTTCNPARRLYKLVVDVDGTDRDETIDHGNFHLFDFNADGRDDLLYAPELVANDPAGYAWRIALSKPNNAGYAGPSTDHLPAGISTGGAGQLQMADFNGDGLLDAIYGVGQGTGGVGSGQHPWEHPDCTECEPFDPNRPNGAVTSLGRTPQGGFPNGSSGFSDPGRNVRPVISMMARDDIGGVQCSVGLKYCFSQRGTVGGYPASRVVELSGYAASCTGTGQPVYTKFVQFDGGIDIVDFDGDGVNDLRVKVVPGDACNSFGTVPPHWVIYRNLGWAGDPAAKGQTTYTPRALSFVRVAAFPVGNGEGQVDTSANIGWRPDETFDYRFQIGDINGDGLSDLVYRTKVSGVTQWVYRLNTGRIEQPGDPAFDLKFLDARIISGLAGSDAEEKSVQLLDYDGDGNADLLYGKDEVGIRRHYIRRWVGGSGGFGSPILLENVVSNAGQNSERSSFVDLDGDGRADQVLVDYDGPNLPDNEIILRRAKATPVDGPSDLRRHVPTDRIHRIINGFGAKTEISYSPLTVFATHRIGADTVSTTYGRGSNVADLRPAMYVVREAASSAPALNTITGQFNADAMSRVAYRYRGARMQAGGRGFLGFEEVQSFDWQTKVEVSTSYQQSFPLIGRPFLTRSRALQDSALTPSGWGSEAATLCARNPSGSACFSYPDAALRQWPSSAGTVLSEGTTDSLFVAYGTTAYPAVIDSTSGLAAPPASGEPLFVYVLESETTSFELNGGGQVKRERNTFTSYDRYGNLLGSRSEILDAAQTILKRVVSTNTYGTSPSDLDGQRFGRLSRSVVATTRGAETVTRTVGFQYAPGTRLLIAEIIEPDAGIVGPDGGPSPALVKAYAHDVYGNQLKSATCSAWHLPGWPGNQAAAVSECASTTRSQLDFAGSTDTVRRYSRVEIGAQDRRYVARELSGFASATGDVATLIVSGRDAYGNPLQTDDVNAVTTVYRYDAFGRKFFESSDVGAWTKTTLRFCDGQVGQGATPAPETVPCPAGIGAIYTGTTASAGAPDRVSYFDRLGREIQSVVEGYAVDEYIATRTAYDNLGRVVRKSVPSKVSSWTAVPASSQDTMTGYDKLGRAVSVSTPDPDAPGGFATTTTTYAALSTVVLPPANKNGFRNSRTEYRNPLGEITRVVDANNLAACYAYTATGELKTVWRQEGGTCASSPPANSTVTTTVYDGLGRKTSMWDADKGTWAFRYNAVGEAIRELTSRGGCTETKYDARGRATSREDWTGGSANACAGTLQHQSLWSYDSRSTGQVATERVSVVSDALPLGELQLKTFDYDGFGRRISVETRITEPETSQVRTYRNSTTYDHFGRVFQELFVSPEFPLPTGVLHEYTDEDADGAPLNDGYFRRLRDAQGLLAGAVHYEAFAMDAFGNVTRERRAGNTTLETVRTYDLQTGRLETISTGNGAVQSWSYDWDAVGNLDSRRDRLLNDEAFNYDALNRLVNDPPAASPITYSTTGNILAKSGSTYEYGASVSTPSCAASPVPGPHAVRKVTQAGGSSIQYCYDASGNQIRSLNSDSATERLIAYTIADQAAKIQYRLPNGLGGQHAWASRFDYGAGRERIRRRDYAAFDPVSAPLHSTTHYVGGAEVIFKAAGGSCGPQLDVTVRREYMGMVLTQLVPAASGQCSPQTRRYYRFVDHLGSTDALFDEAGQPVSGNVDQQRFDAFGRRRQASDWTGIAAATAFTYDTTITRKGYTGHEQLDKSGLIHMNGRIYDPFIARFIQADPVIQDPFNAQSLNRYTYVFNNPLAYTDPSGFSGRPKWIDWALTAVSIYIAVQTGLNPQAALGTATVGTAQQAYLAVATGFVTGGIQGGPKGALQGALTGLAFYSVGQFATNTLGLSNEHIGRALLHGVTGGVLAELQGGSFGHGFVSAGTTKFLSANLTLGDDLASGIAASLIGGTIDELTGGKFANGAVTAAFSYAFSSMAQRVGGAKGGGAGGGGSLARGASRGLTAGELEAAESMFGEGMDWGRVRIWNKKYPLHFGFQKNDMAISPNGGDIYFGPSAYMDDFSVSPGNMSFLVHELAHVWQVQNGFGLTFPPRGYNYAPVLARGGGWAQMTTEGQAEVVTDLYLRMNGYRPNYALPIGHSAATLRSLVPFSVPGYQAPSPPSWGWQP